jgi:hypothetical protein
VSNNRVSILRTIAMFLRGSVLLTAIIVAATAHAQFTRTVDVQFTGACKVLPETIGVVLDGDEGGQFNVDSQKDGHWVGDLPANKIAIPASGTLGSARVHGWRTDCQKSIERSYKGKRVAAFTFKCDAHETKEVDVATDPEVNFSYVRTMPLNPTINKSCNCEEVGVGSGKQPIPDLRFSSKSISIRPGRTRADPRTPFEELRLQLLATKPRPKDCGLLVNDPEVITAANNGPIEVDGIVKILSSQRNAAQGCQAPTLSTRAIVIDERTFPDGKLALKLKKAE